MCTINRTLQGCVFVREGMYSNKFADFSYLLSKQQCVYFELVRVGYLVILSF